MRYKEIVSGRHEMLVKFTSGPGRKVKSFIESLAHWEPATNGIDAIFKCV